MKFILALAATLAVAVTAGCGQSDAKVHRSNAALSARAHADGIALFGTLCSGELECLASPLYNKIAVISHHTEEAVKAHEIDPSDARLIHDKGQKAHNLLDAARKACAQNAKTGQCTSAGSAGAHAMVGQAAEILSTIQ